jgi:hypothetical protein
MVTNESSSRPLNVRVKITTTIPPIIGPAIVPIPPITVEDMRAQSRGRIKKEKSRNITLKIHK